MARGGKQKSTLQRFLRCRVLFYGAAGGIRTSGLWSRSPTLYPAELRPHIKLMLSISNKEYTILLHKMQMEFLWAVPLTNKQGMGILKS